MPQTKKGFTLIELLVVIAIIGILSAVGLTTLHGAREKARDAGRKTDLDQIKIALALYYDDQNPGSFPGVATADTAMSVETGAITALLVPAYLSRMPTTPFISGSEYTYNYIAPTNTSGQVYAILAHLEAANRANVFIINSDGMGGVFSRSTPQATTYDDYTCTSASGKKMVCGRTILP